MDGGISPFFLAWVRLALAAAILFAVAPRQTRELLLRGPRRWIAAYAMVEIALPFPLIAAGEQHVASSIAAIVIATVPLLIALLALRFDHIRAPDSYAHDRDAGRARRSGRAGRHRPERAG